ncbi:protein CgeB, partial [Bacillus sp. RAR_GA_16]|nr:protein CgeB [Bacillus sp. RAR_GA_16]
MKVIYLSSGFQGIYDHIDQVIINAIKLKHDCQSVSLFGGIDNIKSTIEEFNPVLVLTTVGYTFPPQLRNWIQNKGIPIALWLTEDPYYIDLTLPII